jgi:hypothetical protein
MGASAPKTQSTGWERPSFGAKSARDELFYAHDDGLLVGMRQGDYKNVF